MRFVVFTAVISALLTAMAPHPAKAVFTSATSAFEIAADAAYIDATKEGPIIFRDKMCRVILTDKKSRQTTTLQAPEITVHLATAKNGEDKNKPSGIDRMVLKGGPSMISSPERGFLLEATEITIVAPRTGNAGVIESALAKGGVHLNQSQGDTTGDATSDTIEISENGDKAVLTGGVTVHFKDPQRETTLTGNVATITGLQPKNGQPTNPRIVMQGNGEPSHLTATEKPGA